MGRPKQTLPYGESTILQSVVDAVEKSKVDSLTMVLGFNLEEVQAGLQGGKARVVINTEPERGMLSSVQCGIASLTGAPDALLIVLGDQPQLSATTIDALIASAEQSPKSIFLPTNNGKRGHPLLLRYSYKEEILALPLTLGLNVLVTSHEEDIEEAPVQFPEILEDIDTPEDYDRALRKTSTAFRQD
jgi:molybdenum cofactor cytidylyltransferase